MLESWNNICDKAFWGFWPKHDPNMMDALCYEFLAEHEDDVIDGLVGRTSNQAAEIAICTHTSKACDESTWVIKSPADNDDATIEGMLYVTIDDI